MELQEQLSSAVMTLVYLALEGRDQQKAQRAWNKGDWTLKTLIGLSLPESIFNSVTDKEHAKDVWDMLKGTFQVKNIGTRGMLHRKLQSIHCIEGGNVHEVFADIDKLCKQLVCMGTTIADNEYASILIASLPASYEPTVSSLTTMSSTNTVTADMVIKFIIQAYDHSVARGEDEAQSKALLAYARGVKRKVDQSGAGNGGGGVASSAASGTQKPRHGGMCTLYK